MTIQVKICGIRTLEEALGATEAGADLLGFNFYAASLRYIEPRSCAHIVAALRKARESTPLLIGVFVNAPVAQVAQVLGACGLDLAQLHGDEPPSALAELGGRAFKAVRPRSQAEAAGLVQAYLPVHAPDEAPELLVDAQFHGVYGGSGRIADWGVAAALARRCKLLLAGGLHPDNVSQAVDAVHPWGVDVASGVEREPGIKDLAKIRAFIEAVRSAEGVNATG